jgi:hypothetical protein
MSAKGKFGGLEIARVSFWNLVRLGEEGTEVAGRGAEPNKRDEMHKTAIVVSCEEDDEGAEEA